MKKVVIIIPFIAVSIATVIWLKILNKSPLSNNEVNKAADGQHLVSFPQAPAALKASSANLTKENEITIIDHDHTDQLTSTFTRSEAAEKALKASGKLRENLRGEVYLEIDNNHIAGLEAGDNLKLDIPFFDMYQDVAIESTKLDSRGNKTINAAFMINNDIYTTTITINDHAIYGHIETPHGIYSLAGNGQYAWMAEAKDLVHGAIPDKIGGHDHDGSSDPQPIVEPKPITITGK